MTGLVEVLLLVLTGQHIRRAVGLVSWSVSKLARKAEPIADNAIANIAIATLTLTRLVGGDEVGVVDRGQRLHVLHQRLQLLLQPEVEHLQGSDN